jgi:hypothetical protein
MSKTESYKILEKIILSSKKIVLTNQHILTRVEFTQIQHLLVEKFEEIEIRIIRDKVILNIPNNLKLLLSENETTFNQKVKSKIGKSKL